jgi:hypothetical protein
LSAAATARRRSQGGQVEVSYVATIKPEMGSTVCVRLSYGKFDYDAVAMRTGAVAAFAAVTKAIAGRIGFEMPKLKGYAVELSKSDGFDSEVKATVEWADGTTTVGTATDQLVAAAAAITAKFKELCITR